MSEADIKYIERKCYEVVEERKQCEESLEKLCKAVDSLRHSDFWLDGIVDLASEYRSSKKAMETSRFQIHQMIWAMGNEEHKAIWNRIVEGADDEA